MKTQQKEVGVILTNGKPMIEISGQAIVYEPIEIKKSA